MFDMANDSGLFLDHEAIGPLIAKRDGALAILSDGRKVYPLYEGKMFWHFDHRYGTYEGQTEKQANKGVLPRVSIEQHLNPNYRVLPRYWVERNHVKAVLSDHYEKEWFFSWRDVGISERTFIGTIIPRTAAGDKAPVLISSRPPRQAAALVACLCSFLVDYCARQRAMNMKYFVIEQLPLLTPEFLERHFDFLGINAIDWMAARVLELCYTCEELAPFARDLELELSPFCWNSERRAWLQAEIDSAILHLYGLDRDQAEWLIDTFAVLRKYEERDLGEFRTKRLVLEVYDEMAAARASGRAYQTRLSPPPADRSLCHA
jgi:hypothetical protein